MLRLPCLEAVTCLRGGEGKVEHAGTEATGMMVGACDARLMMDCTDSIPNMPVKNSTPSSWR